MKELNLTAAKRDGTGKGINRRLRQTGEIPAIVYGPETTPIPVKLSYKNLYRALHGAPLSNIINLTIEGDDQPMRKVLIREIQRNPVTGELVHLDFHHIAMDRPITLTVPVETVGLPIGVKNFGGIVEHIRRDIEISCLPAHIPESLSKLFCTAFHLTFIITYYHNHTLITSLVSPYISYPNTSIHHTGQRLHFRNHCVK